MSKNHRAYFSWQYDGKVPEVVIEIVSNKKRGELDTKKRHYEHMGVAWYAAFDPAHYLTAESLTLFGLDMSNGQREYRQQESSGAMEGIGLSLTIWEGEFEGISCHWLRWCDPDGKLIPTGKEGRMAETARADKLAAKLLELGVDPDSIG